jgi:hypothetical protein
MSPTPPDPQLPPDLARPDDTLTAVAGTSLRLMAGAVSKRTMEQLQRTLQASPAEFPWQVVTQAVLAEPVDEQRLVQQGLVAQRDWILRGGRETRGPSLGHRTKGLLARLCAQLIFGAVYAIVIVVLLLLLKHKFPGFDIYRVLTWFQQTFGAG